MKTITLMLAIFAFLITKGQKVVDLNEISERPSVQNFFAGNLINALNPTKYVKLVSGSPYYSSEWQKGTVTIADSFQVKNLWLRLDLLDGTFQYKNDKGEEMECSEEVTKIEIQTPNSNEKLVFVPSAIINKNAAKTWYLLLVKTEKLSLLKDFAKTLNESKPYGSSVTEQQIDSNTRYLFLCNNKQTTIKKYSQIIELFPLHKDALKKYVDENDLKIKNENDVKSFVNYLTTLL
jgi:hypothetical protein